jgi:ADP-ribose pyrophosphatase YjhB (NUDIX family)
MLKTYTNNPDFEPQAPYMSDGALGEMMDARPVVCVDILLVNRAKKTVYLPTRISKPAEGLWFIGGGIKRNQDFLEAAQAAMKRETGLEIAKERFEFLAVNRFVWDYRSEPPSQNGRVDINFCFTLELTPTELSHIDLDPHEYDTEKSLRELTTQQLEDTKQNENTIKQVLIDYASAAIH